MSYLILTAMFYFAVIVAMFFACMAFWFWSLNQIDADTIAGQSDTIKALRIRVEVGEALCRAQERHIHALKRGEQLPTEIGNATAMFSKPSTN